MLKQKLEGKALSRNEMREISGGNNDRDNGLVNPGGQTSSCDTGATCSSNRDCAEDCQCSEHPGGQYDICMPMG